MQMIGKKLATGLSIANLQEASDYFTKLGATPINVDLRELVADEAIRAKLPEARLLIVPQGLQYLSDISAEQLYQEALNSPKDTKAFMYGKVVNKHARYNNCFSDFSQEPDYAEKKGTVINFTDVPNISLLRQAFPKIISGNPDVADLQCEGNYYYDVNKTYIGFHGDYEREIVIALRLGADFNIYFNWYKDCKKVGELFSHTLHHGDIYFMSDKTVGRDWKHRSIYTLRHAASKDPKLVGL